MIHLLKTKVLKKKSKVTNFFFHIFSEADDTCDVGALGQGNDGNQDEGENEEGNHHDNQVPGVQDDVQRVNVGEQQMDGGDVKGAVSATSESSLSDSSQEADERDIGVDSEDSELSGDSDGSDDSDGDDLLYQGATISVADAMLAILSLFMRHKLTGQCLNDILSLISLLLPDGHQCVRTLYKFKKYFSMIGQALLIFHYFCSKCEVPLATKTDNCNQCGENTEVGFFLELPLLKQLQSMFSRPGFYDALQFRFFRNKTHENNIEDIYDGNIYKAEMANNGFLQNPNNVSFMWYSDGISIYKSNAFSIWPMYLLINELNYKTRTKRENIILAGLWFGRKKPNPNLFLAPLHNDLNHLKNEGHLFERPDGDPIRVKAKLLLGVADLQGKCTFMRHKHGNGYYGCTTCKVPGQRYDLGNNSSVHVYPYSPVVNLRADDDYPDLARRAVEARRHDPKADVNGVKGPSLLFYMLPSFYACMGIDAMHGLFLGLMRLLTSLWFDSSHSNQHFSVSHLLGVVDERLNHLKPPSYIQRMPRSIAKLIHFWKAFEYKLMFFLLFTSSSGRCTARTVLAASLQAGICHFYSSSRKHLVARN